MAKLRFVLSLWMVLGIVGLPISRSAAQSKPGGNAREPVAIVAGQAIYEEDLLQSVRSQLLQLQNQEYEIKSKGLENLVNQKLLSAEAQKKGITPEKLLEQEVNSRVVEPTDAAVEAYYASIKDKVNRPLDQVKSQIREYLKQSSREQLRQAYFAVLRAQTDVKILLRPPKVAVAYDPARLRGGKDRPITIVEFSEFQCSFCRSAQKTLAQIQQKYPGQISIAFRDFPLRNIHQQAQPSAEASRCAGEQGKFWDYHDLLFTDPPKLDTPSLIDDAKQLGMDEAKFKACLESGKFRDSIERDLQEGTRLGVTGTPAFFINGVFLSGAQPASVFEKIIDTELSLVDKH